jgi:hypothetical protein
MLFPQQGCADMEEVQTDSQDEKANDFSKRKQHS